MAAMRRTVLTIIAMLAFAVPLGYPGTLDSLAVHAAQEAPGVEEVSLLPTKDNTLYEDASGHTSNGAGQHLIAGSTKNGVIRRAVIAFDIANSIPEGAAIESVELSLHMSRTNFLAGPHSIALHKVLTDWGEGSSDAPSNEGQGTTAQPGDATWMHTFFDFAFWTTAGGDFSPTASAGTVVDGIASYTWSSAQMAADVQSWLDDPAGAFGWLLKGNESMNQTTKRFDSREHPAEANRPVLTVRFTPHVEVPTCNGIPATIVGTDGPDVLVGTSGDDVIVGLDGNDIIRGLGGTDIICAGPGDDFVNGGRGRDLIAGEAGNDTLLGRAGHDRIFGGPGQDTLRGFKGHDRLGGGPGADLVVGGLGNDRVGGGLGDDVVVAGPGDDVIHCGPGADFANGGTGLDTATGCETVIRVP